MRPTFLLSPEAWIVFWSYIQKLPKRISVVIGTTPANVWASWDVSSIASILVFGSKRCDSVWAKRLVSLLRLLIEFGSTVGVRQNAIGGRMSVLKCTSSRAER